MAEDRAEILRKIDFGIRDHIRQIEWYQRHADRLRDELALIRKERREYVREGNGAEGNQEDAEMVICD